MEESTLQSKAIHPSAPSHSAKSTVKQEDAALRLYLDECCGVIACLHRKTAAGVRW